MSDEKKGNIDKLFSNLYDHIYDNPCGEMRLLMQCHFYLISYPRHKTPLIRTLEMFDKISVSMIIYNYDYDDPENEYDPNTAYF
jgi:hypothetical protein